MTTPATERLMLDLDMKDACVSDSSLPDLASTLWRAASQAERISKMSHRDVRREAVASLFSSTAVTSLDKMNSLLEESRRLLLKVADEAQEMGDEGMFDFTPSFLLAALHLSNAREDVRASSGRVVRITMSTIMLRASSELIQATNAILDADRRLAKLQER